MSIVYDRVADLSFTNAYVGVVQSSSAVADEIRGKICAAAKPGLEAWFFEHNGGATWIGSSLKHPEPVMAWLRMVHDLLTDPCTTILTVALRNGSEMPKDDASAIRVPGESPLLPSLRAKHFTIYLHHSDEFLVIVGREAAASLIRNAAELMPVATDLVFQQHLAIPTKKMEGPRAPYDPIEAQVVEVQRAVTAEAHDAIKDLARHWREVLRNDVPEDILALSSRVHDEENDLRDLLADHEKQGTHVDVLSQVDRYAYLMRGLRQAATDVRMRIKDYAVPVAARMTYDVTATPTMMRALQRYAEDVAAQLRVFDRVLLPVLGEEYRLTVDPFVLENDDVDQTTIVIEVPAETRLRLGALPVVARLVAALMRNELTTIGEALTQSYGVGKSTRRHTVVDDLFPPMDIRRRRGFYEEVERYDQLSQQIRNVIAADLIATAVAGPAFVFAMARFAVGTLGDLRDYHSAGWRPSLRARLTVCLEYLNALGLNEPRFQSKYLPAVTTSLPEPIVKAVKAATRGVKRPTPTDLDTITATLSDGRVAKDHSPTAILSALWRAVAAGGTYIHEIAALISVATSKAKPT